jgi:hypothetical protein
MQRAKDLTDYGNRINLVRMELKQLLKHPDESTLVVALIQGLREELRLLLSFYLRVLSTPSPSMMLLSMCAILCPSPRPDGTTCLCAFPAEVTRSPSSENVVHEAIVAQLSTLTTQMKALPHSVAAMVASSSRPSSAGAHRHPISCPYCDKRGHT